MQQSRAAQEPSNCNCNARLDLRCRSAAAQAEVIVIEARLCFATSGDAG